MRKIVFIISILISTFLQAQGPDFGPSNINGRDGPSSRFGFDSLSRIVNGKVNAIQAFEKLQLRADAHYNEKRYEKAFNLYLELASYNDKFSQYRVAFMYANGHGTKKDMIEAYAWSYVASETHKKDIVNYHVAVRDRLSPIELEQAKSMATQYRADYGTFAVANKARRLVRKEKSNCVGSRIGSRCDRVTSGGINCSSAGDVPPSVDCLLLGSVGLPSVSGMLPKDLRTVEKNLKNMMAAHNPGRVELRDLEIIED